VLEEHDSAVNLPKGKIGGKGEEELKVHASSGAS